MKSGGQMLCTYNGVSGEVGQDKNENLFCALPIEGQQPIENGAPCNIGGQEAGSAYVAPDGSGFCLAPVTKKNCSVDNSTGKRSITCYSSAADFVESSVSSPDASSSRMCDVNDGGGSNGGPNSPCIRDAGSGGTGGSDAAPSGALAPDPSPSVSAPAASGNAAPGNVYFEVPLRDGPNGKYLSKEDVLKVLGSQIHDPATLNAVADDALAKTQGIDVSRNDKIVLSLSKNLLQPVPVKKETTVEIGPITVFPTATPSKPKTAGSVKPAISSRDAAW